MPDSHRDHSFRSYLGGFGVRRATFTHDKRNIGQFLPSSLAGGYLWARIGATTHPLIGTLFAGLVGSSIVSNPASARSVMDGAHAENARQDDLVQAGSKSAGAFANHAADAGKSTQAKAGPLIFDAEMMIQGAAGMTIDLSRFEQGNLPLAGKYRFDLLMNGQWRGIEEIEFRTTADDADAVPCFERSLLVRIGIDLDKSARGQDNEGSNPMPEGLVCEPLKRYVPGAEVKVDVAEQKIFISVPKYFLRAGSSKTYVDPANWDSGITAGLINYNANLFSSQNEERSYTNG